MTGTPRWSSSGRSPRVETPVPGLDTPLRGYSTTGAETR